MTEIHLTLPARGPFDLLERVARGADLSGLDGLYAPSDPGGLDSLVVAAGALRATRYTLTAAAFSPRVSTPVYAAKFSASLQRFSGGRFGWHLAGAAPDVTAEFLTVAKGVWTAPDFSFEGRHFSVLKGGLGPVLAAGPFPRVYLSGTSPAELELSARHADVHVFDPADDIEALLPAGVTAALRVTAEELGDHLGRAGIYLVTSGEPLRDAYRIGESRVG
ncbi:LLM class flavin-dependent oxidoreductase [Actinocorallia longicatena]|uniref:Luciferase-like domain-containing protein n=1 Tax=Actinocorallia longicatena TaxID=111803 RepID=A0ABP6Q7L1_9ACTN